MIIFSVFLRNGIRFSFKLALVFFLVFPLTVSGMSIGTISFSRHYDNSVKYNEVHKGLYLKHNGFSVGRYTNSAGLKSSFISYEVMVPTRYKNLSYGFTFGIADNYPDELPNVNGYLPIAGLTVKYSVLKVLVTPINTIFGIEIGF